MKTIEVDEDLYRYIASHTQHIGESASDILRRMLKFHAGQRQRSAVPTGVRALPSVAADGSKQQVQQIEALLQSKAYRAEEKIVNRFLLLLSTLYILSPTAFAAGTDSLHGRTRAYFALEQQTLLQNGTHTKPKQIPDTPYWVITNTNTGRKRMMVEHMMQVMQFPEALIARVCSTF